MTLGAPLTPSPSSAAEERGVSPVGSPRRATSRRFEVVTLALFAAYATVLSALHEPWKDETQSWRLAIDSDGLRELLHNSRYEGHPMLFHALLQVVGHLSRSWWAAVALHLLIACGVVFVVLRHAPFSRLEKLLVVAGYFPAYEYAILVREYGLGLLCALAACAAWTAPRARPVLAIVFLVLLANTSVLGLLIGLAAAGAFLAEWLWTRLSASRLTRRTIAFAAIGLLVTAVLLWLVARQVMPPGDAAFKGDGALVHGFSSWRLGWGATLLLRALVPIAAIGEGTVQWNLWILEPTGRAMLGAEAAASTALFVVGCLIASRRWSSLLFFAVSTVGLSLFFVLFVQGWARHHGHLVVAWIMAAWLSRSGPATDWPALLRPVAERARGWAPRLFVLSLIPMTVAAVEFAAGDIVRPFSDARNVADLLRARGLGDAPLIAVSRSDAQAVGALMDRPIVFPSEGRSGTFVVWGDAASAFSTPAQLETAADTALRRVCEVVYIGTTLIDLPSSLAPSSRLIYETPRRAMSPERFRVWLRSAPRSSRCPTPVSR